MPTANVPFFCPSLVYPGFWLLGAAYLTQLPNFTKTVLGGGESVVTLLLALFSIGVGVGSLLCERLSDKRVWNWGWCRLGSIGLSLFGIDLFWACRFPEAHGLMPLNPVSGSVRQASGS